jgi:hypothetical protein
VAKYLSKPVEVDAMVFEGTFASHDKLMRWMARHENGTDTPDVLNTAYRGVNIKGKPARIEFCFAVAKNDGAVSVLSKGDAIIRELDGDGFYPCREEVFWQKHDLLINHEEHA